MADCISAIPLPCSLPQIWGTQSHILRCSETASTPFPYSLFSRRVIFLRHLVSLPGKSGKYRKREENCSYRQPLLQKRSQAPEQHSHEWHWLIHTREAHRQGSSARGATCKETLQVRPSGERASHKSLLCKNTLAKTGRQAKHFRHGIKEKTKVLLNPPALPCQKTRMETITFKSKGRSYSKEQQANNKKPPPVHCCLGCRKHHLPRQLVKSSIK